MSDPTLPARLERLTRDANKPEMAEERAGPRGVCTGCAVEMELVGSRSVIPPHVDEHGELCDGSTKPPADTRDKGRTMTEHYDSDTATGMDITIDGGFILERADIPEKFQPGRVLSFTEMADAAVGHQIDWQKVAAAGMKRRERELARERQALRELWPTMSPVKRSRQIASVHWASAEEQQLAADACASPDPDVILGLTPDMEAVDEFGWCLRRGAVTVRLFCAYLPKLTGKPMADLAIHRELRWTESW